MMYDAIKNFHTQFAFDPVIENQDAWKKYDRFLIAGMGGSHLAADLLKVWNPNLDLIIHADYGLPSLPDKNRLIILSSYSGNTEEVLDTYTIAKEGGLPIVALSVGGELISRAKKDGIPFIEIPDTGIQSRSALGYSFKSLLKIMGEEAALEDAAKLSQVLDPAEYEAAGSALAERLRDFIPVIYSSARNYPIAYNWKIKFNETGKIPAFLNRFPELNHNEMTGFDVMPQTKDLSKNFYFLFLKDQDDHPRILKRMEITEKLFLARQFVVETIALQGEDAFEKIFSSLLLADWTAYYLGERYGVETEAVPMVEEFKGLMQR